EAAGRRGAGRRPGNAPDPCRQTGRRRAPARREGARTLRPAKEAQGPEDEVTIGPILPEAPMAGITYLKGDATCPQAKGVKIICHVCNDIGGWGKGFVLALSKRWSEPEAAYRKW